MLGNSSVTSRGHLMINAAFKDSNSHDHSMEDATTTMPTIKVSSALSGQEVMISNDTDVKNLCKLFEDDPHLNITLDLNVLSPSDDSVDAILDLALDDSQFTDTFDPDIVSKNGGKNDDSSSEEIIGGNENTINIQQNITNSEDEVIGVCGERKRCRKRKAEPNEWKKNITSRCRKEGKAYEYRDRKKKTINSGNVNNIVKVEERKLGPPCTRESCKKSKKRFCQDFLEGIRKEIFKHFWEVLSWDERKTLVSSLVDCTKPAQKRRSWSGDRRGNTLHYHLKINGERKKVCKEMFISTLSIGDWSAQNWAKEGEHGMRSGAKMDYQDSDKDSDDDSNKDSNKGNSVRSSKRPKKQTDEDSDKDSDDDSNKDSNKGNSVRSSKRPKKQTEKKTFAMEYIDSLPKMESHYCRKDTSKLYLEPVFTTFEQLYDLYLKQYYQETKKKALSKTSFSEILKSKNISLFSPKKDQCDICCQHEVGNLSDEDYELHKNEKKRARAEKDEDKERANQKKCKVICVDVQAVKLSPRLNTSALYYKTKLCCHNYTVFDMTSKDVLCYWWNESEGELKSSNFISCLIDYLETLISSWPSEVEREIIIWSDGCGYQNKNKVLSNALLQFSISNNITIVQKFLVRGHTQMECDSVHAKIETKLKNRSIFLPHEYISVTEEARKRPFPYRTKYLSHEFFKDFSETKFERFSSIRPGNKKADPTVHQICTLKYVPTGSLYYKLNFDDGFLELNRRVKPIEGTINYPKMYKSRLKIKQTKYEHLQQLKNVLPVDAHAFYDNLPH